MSDAMTPTEALAVCSPYLDLLSVAMILAAMGIVFVVGYKCGGLVMILRAINSRAPHPKEAP